MKEEIGFLKMVETVKKVQMGRGITWTKNKKSKMAWYSNKTKLSLLPILCEIWPIKN